jgi:hypothetical protein
MRMTRIVGSATVALAVLGITGPAPAQDRDEQIRLLLEENERMRDQLREQADRLDAIEAREEVRAAPTGSVSASAHSEDRSPVVSRVPIRLTGFLKGDMLWNNSRLDSTSAPRLAAPGGMGSDDQFTGTVQHSRIAAILGPVPVENSTIGGTVEMDLFNLSDSGDANYNNNQLRVRQLFMNIDHGDWTVLAGQTWDLISPLNPTTLNTNGNYWFGGNGGFRRPQLQVTRRIGWGEGAPLVLKGSVNANIGRTTMVNGTTFNSGRESGTPLFEAAIEQNLTGFGAGPVRLGLAGGYGQEDLEGVKNNIEQWVAGAYLRMPVVDWLTLTGEIQRGENTDAFLMGGGINAKGNAIQSTGGWLQATLTPLERLELNLLVGIDDPKDGDVDSGGMTKNMLLGVGARWKAFSPLTIGLEYTYFDTDYKALSSGTAHLGWASMIFDF